MADLTTINSIKLEMKLDGATWTDVTADTRSKEKIRIKYGIFGQRPSDRTAGVGSLTFTMDDSAKNSGGLLGYYSPGHANARSGFELNLPVRIVIAVGTYYSAGKYGEVFYGPNNYVKFVGKLKRIQVESGPKEARRTRCTVYDFMWESRVHKMNLLETKQTRRSNLIISDVVGNMTEAPEATEYATGQEVFTYAADDLKDEKSTALTVFNKVAISELGFVYVKGDDVTGGVLVFEDRHARLTTTPKFILGEGDIKSVRGSRAIEMLYNVVKATSYPRNEGASNEVLWTMQRTMAIAANSTETIVARYVDPDQKAVRLSGVDLVDLVGGTDYKFGSTEGSGTNDKQADLSVVEDFGSNSAELALENTSGVVGYVNLLQIRGKAIRIFEPIITEREDATSITAYGHREYTIAFPYQDSNLVVDDFADVILESNKDPRVVFEDVTLIGKTGLKARAMVALEPGDRITLTDSLLGIASQDYFVQAVSLTIIPPDILTASFVPMTSLVVSATDNWFLGVVGDSEIGDNTFLGV